MLTRDATLFTQAKEAELTHAQAEHATELREAHARQASLMKDLQAATALLRAHEQELASADALLTQERDRVASAQQEAITARAQLASCRYDSQRASSEHALEVEALHLELQQAHCHRDNLRQLHDDVLVRATDAERRAVESESRVVGSAEALATLRDDLEALAVASDAAVAAARQAGREEAAPVVAALESRLADAEKQHQADAHALEQLRASLAAAEAASRAQAVAASEQSAQAADMAQSAMEALRSELAGACTEVIRLRNEGVQAADAAQGAVERLRAELQNAREGNDEAVQRLIAQAREAGAAAAKAAARAELALPLAVCAAQHRALGTAIAIGRLAEAHSRMPPGGGEAPSAAEPGSHSAAVRALIKRCVRATAALKQTCHAVLSRGEHEAAQHALRASADDVELTTDEVAILERAIASAKAEAAAAVAHAAAQAVAHERVDAIGGPYWVPLSRPTSPSRAFSPTRAPQRSPSPGRRMQASTGDAAAAAERASSPLRARLERLRQAAREALVDVR